MDIALVTEAGVRYMALKNVSLDLSFRYRFGSPAYTVNTPAVAFGGPVNVKYDTNQFSALSGLLTTSRGRQTTPRRPPGRGFS